MRRARNRKLLVAGDIVYRDLEWLDGALCSVCARSFEEGDVMHCVQVRDRPRLVTPVCDPCVKASTGEAECSFCHGHPVSDAQVWVDGKPQPPAPCPRCGKTSQADQTNQEEEVVIDG